MIDVMPTDERILGFSNRWYAPAISSAGHVDIAGLLVRVIAPTYFLATKLEAFRGRGDNDYGGSHDLEDVMAVIDGRLDIVEEVRATPADVRTFVGFEIGKLLGTRAFIDALPGFLLPDSASQARHSLLLERLKRLAESDAWP